MLCLLIHHVDHAGSGDCEGSWQQLVEASTIAEEAAAHAASAAAAQALGQPGPGPDGRSGYDQVLLNTVSERGIPCKVIRSLHFVLKDHDLHQNAALLSKWKSMPRKSAAAEACTKCIDRIASAL